MAKRIILFSSYPVFFVSLIGLFASCATICLAEDAQLYLARMNVCSLVEAGKYTEAASATDKLLADFAGNKDLPGAQYWIAERYERKDRFEQAQQSYQRIITDYPDSPAANEVKMGLSRTNIKLLIASEKYDLAKTSLDKFVADFADNNDLPASLFWITEMFQRSDRFEDAKVNYRRIIEKFPNSPCAGEARVWLSRIIILSRIESGDYNGAKAALDKFTADFTGKPYFTEALFWIAERFQRFDRFEEASQIYRRLIQDYPGTQWAGMSKLWLSRINIISQIASEDYDGARVALDKFNADFAGNPDLADALFWISERYERLGRFDEANRVYQQLTQKFPNSHWADKVKLDVSRADVMAFIVSEKYDLAKEALNKLIADFASHPRLPGTLYWIAERYQRQNRFEEANRLYKQISANYPANLYADKAKFDIVVTDIHILLNVNEINQAEILTDKFIADFKNDTRLPEAVYQIGENYFDRAFSFDKDGLNTQAKEYYRKALTVWEKIATQMPFSEVYTPQASYAVANCYSDIGDYNTAINIHKKVIADYPDFEIRYMAMFMLADCYRKKATAGELAQQEGNEQIIGIYRDILAQYPDCKIATIVQNQLLQLDVELH